MIAFFALIGEAVSNGRMRIAFMMLTAIGVDRRPAWAFLDGWEKMREEETTTGWTPEVVAMGFVMGAVDRWRVVQWSELIGQFATSADPDGAGGS